MKTKSILLLALISVAMTSCYSSKIYNGQATPETPMVKVNKNNNSTFLFGLIPTKKADNQVAKNFVGETPDYMSHNKMSFVDGLLGVVTFGIYTPTTTYYYLPYNSKISAPKKTAK